MRKPFKNTVAIGKVLTELQRPAMVRKNPSNAMTAQLFHCWKAKSPLKEIHSARIFSS